MLHRPLVFSVLALDGSISRVVTGGHLYVLLMEQEITKAVEIAQLGSTEEHRPIMDPNYVIYKFR